MKVQGTGAILNTKDGKVIPATDPCCCGDDPPTSEWEWWVLTHCDGSLSTKIFPVAPQYGPAGEHMGIFDPATGICYYLPIDATTVMVDPVTYETTPPGYSKINNLVSGFYPANCDHALCSSGPDPNVTTWPPFECACGTLTSTANCHCEPTEIRVTIDGTTNCLCLECGTYNATSARMATGTTIDGTYDLPRIGPGEYYLEIDLDYVNGYPGVPCVDTIPFGVFGLWLKKVSPTAWQFIVAGGAASPASSMTNPHDDPGHGFQVLFKGLGVGNTQSCLAVPTMTNMNDCGFVSYPSNNSLGETECTFYVTDGGTASFDSCY